MSVYPSPNFYSIPESYKNLCLKGRSKKTNSRRISTRWFRMGLWALKAVDVRPSRWNTISISRTITASSCSRPRWNTWNFCRWRRRWILRNFSTTSSTFLKSKKTYTKKKSSKTRRRCASTLRVFCSDEWIFSILTSMQFWWANTSKNSSQIGILSYIRMNSPRLASKMRRSRVKQTRSRRKMFSRKLVLNFRRYWQIMIRWSSANRTSSSMSPSFVAVLPRKRWRAFARRSSTSWGRTHLRFWLRVKHSLKLLRIRSFRSSSWIKLRTVSKRFWTSPSRTCLSAKMQSLWEERIRVYQILKVSAKSGDWKSSSPRCTSSSSWEKITSTRSQDSSNTPYKICNFCCSIDQSKTYFTSPVTLSKSY